MNGILAAMRGMQRALRSTTRAMRAAVPLAAPSTIAATPDHRPLDAALLLIDADRLNRFARSLARYSRAELAEISDDVAEIPAAVAAVAAQFDDWQRAEVATDTHSAFAKAHRITDAATAHVARMTARNRERRSLSLRLISRERLRPLSPRSPGLPALA